MTKRRECLLTTGHPPLEGYGFKGNFAIKFGLRCVHLQRLTVFLFTSLNRFSFPIYSRDYFIQFMQFPYKDDNIYFFQLHTYTFLHSLPHFQEISQRKLFKFFTQILLIQKIIIFMNKKILTNCFIFRIFIDPIKKCPFVGEFIYFLRKISNLLKNNYFNNLKLKISMTKKKPNLIFK